MFRRVLLESWHDYVPYICFALIGGAFLAIIIRAVLMKPSEIDRLSSMPLRDDDQLREEREEREKGDKGQADPTGDGQSSDSYDNSHQ